MDCGPGARPSSHDSQISRAGQKMPPWIVYTNLRTHEKHQKHWFTDELRMVESVADRNAHASLMEG
eukprot:1174016-Pyramimonas_sp.AAC.1